MAAASARLRRIEVYATHLPVYLRALGAWCASVRDVSVVEITGDRWGEGDGGVNTMSLGTCFALDTSAHSKPLHIA